MTVDRRVLKGQRHKHSSLNLCEALISHKQLIGIDRGHGSLLGLHQIVRVPDLWKGSMNVAASCWVALLSSGS